MVSSASASSYVSALHAATQAACGQNYPASMLYVVATPIGNLADITLRALHVLAIADAVACEDTRHTQTLLRAYGIDKKAQQLLSVHQHNEAQAAEMVMARLREGQRIALVSDAGTPAISDPGARLVKAVRECGLAVRPLPGASSVTALLSVAGLSATGALPDGFAFFGFLPARGGERLQALEALRKQAQAVVLLEAPHRMDALARDLATLGTRVLTVGRELTKQFEEIDVTTAESLASWLDAAPQRRRGEFVLVLHPGREPQETQASDTTLALLMQHLPLKTAVSLAAQIHKSPRNALYRHALALQGSGQAVDGQPEAS